jgi:hypothetical protein
MRAVLVLALLSLAAGCAGAREPPAAEPPPPPPPASGGVSFTFLPLPGARITAEELGFTEFVEPTARTELDVPEYPEEALSTGVSPFTVAVRLTIDPLDGRVTRVEQSPLLASSEGAFEKDFWIASERAVRLWRFTPGRMDRYQEGADVDGDGKSDSRMRAESIPVPVFYDVRFDFAIRAGTPEVKTSAEP